MRIIQDKEKIAAELGHGDESRLIIPQVDAVHAVCFPQTVDDLHEALTDYQSFPKRVAGSRTGLTGGSVPQLGKDGISEVLIRVDQLLTVPTFEGYETKTEEIESLSGKRTRTITYATDGKTFILPAGVTLHERTKILADHGRMFPIHPTSQDASAGGTVTTNATGLEGAFGSTRDWTEVLGIFLADGRFAHLTRFGAGEPTQNPGRISLPLMAGDSLELRLPTYQWNDDLKNASGIFTGKGNYPFDLFVGHDGALGICAYAGFRSLPKRVKNRPDIWAGMIFFDDYHKALDFILCATEEYGLRNGRTLTHIDGQNRGVVGIDWMGGAGLEIGKRNWKRGGVPSNATVALEIGVLMDDKETAEKVAELMDRYHALEESWFDPDKVGEIRDFRHSIPVKLVGAAYRLIITDGAVPLNRMKEMHEYWLQQSADYANFCQRLGFEGVGDQRTELGHPFRGHMHYGLLNSRETLEEARKIQGRVFQKIIELGGVPSAEHGIGTKTAYIERDGRYVDVPLVELLYGREAMDEVRDLRRQLGAENLNRGVLTPIDR